jgi:hypothetical protein
VRSVAENVANTIPEQADGRLSAVHEPSSQSRVPEAIADLAPPAEDTSTDHRPSPLAAVQPQAPQNFESDEISARRRTHGSALPR